MPAINNFIELEYNEREDFPFLVKLMASLFAHGLKHELYGADIQINPNDHALSSSDYYQYLEQYVKAIIEEMKKENGEEQS